MCGGPFFDKELVVGKVKEILSGKRRPMKTKEMAKFICKDYLPVHKGDLNRVLDRYIKAGGSDLGRDEDGYWSLISPPAASNYSGEVSYEDLVGKR